MANGKRTNVVASRRACYFCCPCHGLGTTLLPTEQSVVVVGRLGRWSNGRLRNDALSAFELTLRYAQDCPPVSESGWP